MKAKIFLLCISMCVLTQCGPDYSQWDKYNFKSFLCRYYIIEGLAVKQLDERCLEVSSSGNSYYSQFDEKSREQFNMLSVKNNDLNFNTKFKRLRGEHVFCSSYTPNISSLKAYCTDYFNTTHPSGSSLDDIVRFMSLSLHRYILSNYKDTFTSGGSNLEEPFKDYYVNYYSRLRLDYPQFRADEKAAATKPYFPVNRLLKDLKPDDLLLLMFQKKNFYTETTSEIGYLYFDELPDTPGDYDIRVEITDENGKVYSSTITMKFDF